ncbi:hypothetical protein [Enterovibrio nigricans]|uniref:Outer membrane protein beta-barrel domain-containing protein n=1 Tax=Enterovibrio nigricans DSM 22720 TaxID=1121868 RepID=A0A1T4UFG3_9GAMM|nr:hypothetical protein [Enterovibrio nigricans]SKA51505.1 hypothetical protein SAMN02745132_01622 [Enterovibrio nigricans DSM 22720]
MAKIIRSVLVLVISLSSLSVHAKGERYGISGALRSIDSITYEEGMSGTAETLSYGIVHTRPIDENNNRWRWWLAANYTQDSIMPDASGVYQELIGLDLRIIPQYALASWGPFTPYIGGGLSFGYQQYANRWQVDDEGYKYGEQLEDIGQFEAGLIFTFGTAIKFGSNSDNHLQLVPQISYTLPIYNEGIGGAELSVSLLF